MTDDRNTKFEHWALVELMGHQRIAGLVSEQTIGGKGFIRVDVPKANGEIAFTRFFGPDAIYAISPTDRQIAIGLAIKAALRPVSVYDLASLVADKKVGQGEERYEHDEA
jgi:hypothetical protein